MSKLKDQTSTPLKQESQSLNSTLAFLSVCCVTGGILWLDAGPFQAQQIAVLLHAICGAALCFYLCIYSVFHFKRAQGKKKPLITVTGLVLLVSMFLYLGASIAIFFLGHRADLAWLFSTHEIGSVLIVALLALHIVLYRFLKYRSAKRPEFTTLDQRSPRVLASYVAYSCLAIVLGQLMYTAFIGPEEIRTITDDYELPYGDHPFRPSQTETTSNQLINKEDIANSHQCFGCHEEISKQWLSSAHRLAAADPSYVTNISLLAETKGIAATRYCEGCHAPVALLSGELSGDGKHGGISGTKANHEGISCVSCHRATKATHLDGVASYHFEPATEYLFQHSKNPVLNGLSRKLVELYADRHKEDMGSEYLKDPAHCATCHAQFMDKSMNDWGWVKMQDEYKAWLSSPYSQASGETFKHQENTRCQDCHMPLVKSSDPAAGHDGKVRSHRFVGANTLLPFLAGDEEQLAETISFLQSNKLQISIEPPHRSDATQTLTTLNEPLRSHSQTPFYTYLNESVEITVSVSNNGVGHDFPGGTTDINQAWIEFNVQDAMGERVFKSGSINKNDVLDDSAHIYQSIPIDRNGQHVWKHDLFNMIGETYRNTIPSGKSDIVKYKFQVPSWAKNPLTASATLKYRKLNTRYAKWALGDKYRPLPIVDMANSSLTIEVRTKPEANGSENET